MARGGKKAAKKPEQLFEEEDQEEAKGRDSYDEKEREEAQEREDDELDDKLFGNDDPDSKPRARSKSRAEPEPPGGGGDGSNSSNSSKSSEEGYGNGNNVPNRHVPRPPQGQRAVFGGVYPSTPGLLDMTSPSAKKLFDRTTKPFQGDEPFNADAKGLYGFIQNLKFHALKYGWMEPKGLMWIPKEVNTPSIYTDGWTNLIESYGQVTLEHIRTYQETYLTSQNRMRQDDAQLFFALRNSLTEQAKNRLNLYKDQYTVNKYPSGLLFFKVIVRESHIDTNATSMSIRNKLGELPQYMADIQYDIKAFNEYVLELLEALHARGETTNDLLSNLYKTYCTVKDDEFAKYMKDKKSAFEEGSFRPNIYGLMEYAKNKYERLMEDKEWSILSKNDMIIALQAQQETTTKEIKNLRRGKETGPAKEKYIPKAAHGGGGGGGTKTTMGLPSWMTVEPPAEDLKKSRKHNNKDWWWCSKKTGGKCEPGRYRIHKPNQCKGTAGSGASAKRSTQQGKKEQQHKKKLKISSALMATMGKGEGNDSDTSIP